MKQITPKFCLPLLLLIATALPAYAQTIDPLAPDLVKARVEPIGEVNVAKPAAPASAEKTTSTPATANSANTIGQKIYDSKCFVCHATGLAGAPKFGDAAAWDERLKKGMDVLFDHVKNGFNSMPPKGTCVDCTDDDLKAAIGYLSHHGAAKK